MPQSLPWLWCEKGRIGITMDDRRTARSKAGAPSTTMLQSGTTTASSMISTGDGTDGYVNKLAAQSALAVVTSRPTIARATNVASALPYHSQKTWVSATLVALDGLHGFSLYICARPSLAAFGFVL